MFSFFKKISKPTNSGGEGDKPLLDVHAICMAMRHFPVGAKVNYYPEYRKEIMMESVVIAYAINDNVIYSTSDLSCDERSGTVRLIDQGKQIICNEIKSFHIVVPVFTQSEAKLDYVRREELLKVGGLVPGNTITLMGEQQNGQVPVLDTTVHKRAMFKDGYYANHTVALLEVNLESLMLADQRSRLRLQTDLPAVLRLAQRDEYKLLNCVLADFSDISLRLAIDPDSIVNVNVKERDDVIVTFNLPGQSQQISLTGNIFRVTDSAVVVTLKGMLERGQTARLGQIDILKIKANLLQHGRAHLPR
jgi:hypothetical protein